MTVTGLICNNIFSVSPDVYSKKHNVFQITLKRLRAIRIVNDYKVNVCIRIIKSQSRSLSRYRQLLMKVCLHLNVEMDGKQTFYFEADDLLWEVKIKALV